MEAENKKQDLELQLNEASLSFPEARDRLLNKIKVDNASISDTDKRIRDVRKNIEYYEKKLRELADESKN